MKHAEIKAIALQAYQSLPKPQEGVKYILIAVEPTTGSYQPVVSNMDATYLIGVLSRCILSIERAVFEANEKVTVAAEDVKIN